MSMSKHTRYEIDGSRYILYVNRDRERQKVINISSVSKNMKTMDENIFDGVYFNVKMYNSEFGTCNNKEI